MKKGPYNLSDAEQICAHYQYLMGKNFSADVEQPINCVAVAPYTQTAKERFILYYLICNDANSALGLDAKVSQYDVLVMAASSDNYDLAHEDIYSWLTRNNVPDETTMSGNSIA
jgi:hypothetical protein